jgi:hypothetical protein
VPLTNVQIDILRLLAAHRDPEGDRQERVSQAALSNVAVLVEADSVAWLRPLPMIYTAAVTKDDAGPRL